MKDLTIGNEAKLIFKFALPMVFGNLLQQLYHLVDSIIVGNYLGKEALAALGASSPIFYALIAFVIGIGSGATIIISQYFGAKNLDKVKRAIDTTYIFLFVASIIITSIGIFFSEEIFRLLHVEEKVIPLATEYFNVFMIGMIAFFGFSGTSSILRGLGDSMTPLYFMVIATFVNIALDIIFIVVFNWGISGVAYATVIAQAGAFISGAIYLNKKHQIISFNVFKFRFDKELFLQSIRIGLPTGFQQTFVALGIMALIRIVNNFDTDVLAAFSVASRIDALAAMPALNLASALSAFVGQNLGAQRVDRIKKGLRATLFMAWGMSLIVMLSVIFFGEHMMSAFTKDQSVIDHGANYLVIVSSFYMIFSTMFVMHGVLRGAGDTLIPMFITLFSLWVIRIPFALVLSKHFGVNGIWWAIPIGWSMGLIGSLFYYLSGRWKYKGVVRQQSK
ncbi:MATE family efflux transporter [Carboxylicivirga mesophila]|uniref:Multidrug-efflux transporter n=1 Tax=Carboxylicivirga mesophila TaxID=1166478 RepID=A0ABS5KAC5_9BACT|nr:MATE family efflux transporter [Carboxylicivirga mesophila]MBS2211463.1 MATE family efflux transporter [Carboxylicivirga mesophila]